MTVSFVIRVETNSPLPCLDWLREQVTRTAHEIRLADPGLVSINVTERLEGREP